MVQHLITQPTPNEKQQSLYSYADFTYLPSMFFKTMGYDFLNEPRPRWQNFLLRLYFTVCFLSCLYNVFYMVKRIYEWDTIGRSARIIMRYAVLVSFVMNSFVKFTTFTLCRKSVRKLNMQIEEIYPATQAERAAYKVNRYYWPRFVSYILILYFITSLMMVVGPMMQSIGIYLYEFFKYGGDKAKFPYLRCYPHKLSFHSFGVWRYTLTYILELTFSHYLVSTNLGTDIWIVFLTAQICMQFDNIARTLAEYQPGRSGNANDCEFLGRLIRKHNYILSLNKELDRLFGVLVIYNILCTASLLCSAAFYSITQGINMEALSYLLFIIPAAGQFYIVCYYGQMLIITSEKIAEAAYEHTWYNGSITYKKMLILIMQRAQRPATMSAKGFMIISLDTFKILMNISYRFFTVIRTTLKK